MQPAFKRWKHEPSQRLALHTITGSRLAEEFDCLLRVPVSRTPLSSVGVGLACLIRLGAGTERQEHRIRSRTTIAAEDNRT